MSKFGKTLAETVYEFNCLSILLCTSICLPFHVRQWQSLIFWRFTNSSLMLEAVAVGDQSKTGIVSGKQEWSYTGKHTNNTRSGWKARARVEGQSVFAVLWRRKMLIALQNVLLSPRGSSALLQSNSNLIPLGGRKSSQQYISQLGIFSSYRDS